MCYDGLLAAACCLLPLRLLALLACGAEWSTVLGEGRARGTSTHSDVEPWPCSLRLQRGAAKLGAKLELLLPGFGNRESGFGQEFVLRGLGLHELCGRRFVYFATSGNYHAPVVNFVWSRVQLVLGQAGVLRVGSAYPLSADLKTFCIFSSFATPA